MMPAERVIPFKEDAGMNTEKIMQYQCRVCGRRLDVTRTGDVYEEPIYCCGVESLEVGVPGAAPRTAKKAATKKPATKKVAKKKAAKKKATKKTAKKTVKTAKKAVKKKTAKKAVKKKATKKRR
jgi:hypothetical protein